MPLSKHQIKHLITLTHNLKPVIMVGQNGITKNLLNELEVAVNHHELVKIKISGDDRESRDEIISQLLKSASAEKVKAIGKTLTLFRRNTKNPKIEFPKK